jgi:hypothetical protein
MKPTTWIKAAAVRAVKTFAQTAVSLLTVGQAFIDVNWQNVLSISATAAVISILTSLGGLPEVNTGDGTAEDGGKHVKED